MTEPTYEYVRGKGWMQVLGHIVTMACGTAVRCENRRPNPGERYSLVFKEPANISQHWITEDYQADSRWFSYIKNEEFRELDECSAGDIGYWSRSPQDRIFLTLVPV